MEDDENVRKVLSQGQIYKMFIIPSITKLLKLILDLGVEDESHCEEDDSVLGGLHQPGQLGRQLIRRLLNVQNMKVKSHH